MPVPGVTPSSPRAVKTARALVLVLSMISPLGAREAHAQATKAEERAADLFDEGMQALQQGANLNALSLFREVSALVPVPEAHWNIIVAEWRLGMYVEARRELEKYLAASDKLTPDRLKEAAELRDEFEKKLARLTLDIEPAGAFVLLDGEPSPRQIWVAPGEHRLHVTAPGRVAEKSSISLEAGERRTVVVRLPSPPPPPPPPPPRQFRAGLTLIGIGAAGLATGVILGALAVEHKSSMESLCPHAHCRTASDASTYLTLDAEAARLAGGTNLALALGVAVTGIGALIAFVPWQSSPRRPAVHKVSFSIAPPTRGAGGLGFLQGEF